MLVIRQREMVTSHPKWSFCGEWVRGINRPECDGGWYCDGIMPLYVINIYMSDAISHIPSNHSNSAILWCEVSDMPVVVPC